MVWKAIKDIVRRFDAVLSGYGECRGVFKITDENGALLGGVTVCYKVDDSEWIPCGASQNVCLGSGNFTQLSTVYYPIGRPVSWRFHKDGFGEVEIVRYTADKEFDEKLNTVVMSVSEEAVPGR